VVGIGNNGFYNISGKVYLDLNQNGIPDGGEPGVANRIVNIQPINLDALTNPAGDYHAIVPPGSYNVNWATNAGWNLTSTPATHNITISSSSVSGLDFGIYPDSTLGSANIIIYSGVPRCQWNVPYYLNVYNNGYTMLNGDLTFTHDPAQVYVSSSVPPTSIVGNTLTYSVTNLGPGQVFSPSVTLLQPVAGTPLTTTLIIDATDVFSNVVNDTVTLNQVVTCSYDPNDKSVEPPGQGSANFVPMNEWLTYLVRFQNTGNDTAFKVVILDTLDLNLDISTFSVLGSSHTMSTNINSARQISFTFENILLPDSNINEPGSHGYVLYRIKGLTTNPDPTVVENTAYIYFDLNAPVQTNTTLTTFSDNWVGIADPKPNDLIIVYPNPMSQSAVVEWKGEEGDVNFVIRDIYGRVIISEKSASGNRFTIDRNNLAPGIYLIEASSVKTSTTQHLRLVVR
jgi:uncharacterized repeat protein (TIGR01451 family)